MRDLDVYLYTGLILRKTKANKTVKKIKGRQYTPGKCLFPLQTKKQKH